LDAPQKEYSITDAAIVDGTCLISVLIVNRSRPSDLAVQHGFFDLLHLCDATIWPLPPRQPLSSC